MKTITKIDRLGNGKSRVSFTFPLTIFEYLILPALGIGFITLSATNIKDVNSLVSNILIGCLGIVGLLLVVAFLDLVALNFRTLVINQNSGMLIINRLFVRSKIKIDQISHVVIKKERNSGASDSNGFVQYSDWFSAFINLKLKSGKSIKLVPIKGGSVNNQNAYGKLMGQSKKSAKDIAKLLSVAVKTE